MRALFDGSPEPVWLIRGNRIVDGNDAAVRMMGCSSKDELLLKLPADFSPKFQPDGQLSHVKAVEMGKLAWIHGVHRFDWVHCKLDGQQFDAEVTLTHMQLASGPAVYCTWRDVTRRKQAERDRQALARQLELALQQARLANESKSRILAMVSHDVRSPLNSVLGMAGLLLDESLDPTLRQDYVRGMLRSGRMMLFMLDELIQTSQLESGALKIAPQPVSMKSFVDDVVRLYEPSARAKGLVLEGCWCGQPDAIYMLDELRVQQMVGNFVTNAIKFTESGQVQITATEVVVENGQTMLEVVVEDTGIGVPPADGKRIFEAYFQSSEAATGRYGGAGLGLSIVRQLAELMGGSVGQAPGKECGSRFWFRIRVSPIKPQQVLSQAGLHALVVDDSETNRQVMLGMLRKLGLRCDVAWAGAEALERLEEGEHWDLVLMDLHMPGESGLEVVRAWRMIEARHGLNPACVLAVSGDLHPFDWPPALEAGINGCLGKPLSLATLRQTLHAMGLQSPS